MGKNGENIEQRRGDVLDVEEAADFLRIPRATVYKLAQEGGLPCRKVGRRWRFSLIALESWLAGSGYDQLAADIMQARITSESDCDCPINQAP